MSVRNGAVSLPYTRGDNGFVVEWELAGNAARGRRNDGEGCQRQGCAQRVVVTCAYVDRRRRECRTDWCSDHSATVADRHYCLRHAGVVRALLEGDAGSVAPPDLDNRAPSLVRWVGGSISADMERVLRSVADQGSWFATTSIALAHVGPERERWWTRRWSLLSHTGLDVTITLMVAEARDHEVVIRVNLETVARSVPPWIHDRVAGGSAEARADFQDRLVERVRLAVDRAPR